MRILSMSGCFKASKNGAALMTSRNALACFLVEEDLHGPILGRDEYGVLLVTWLTYGHPAVSTQTAFSSLKASEDARDAIPKYAERIKAEYEQRDKEAAQAANGPHKIPPSVTAVCTPQ